MLPAAYYWLELSDGWLLRINYRGVANVSEFRTVRLRWQGELYEWQEASPAQARVAIEQWIFAANDLPAKRGRG